VPLIEPCTLGKMMEASAVPRGQPGAIVGDVSDSRDHERCFITAGSARQKTLEFARAAAVEDIWFKCRGAVARLHPNPTRLDPVPLPVDAGVNKRRPPGTGQ